MKVKNLLYVLILPALLLTGCYPGVQMQTKEAQLGPMSNNYKDLVSLPKAKEKIVCAVYKFRDQTGQYKQTANGTSWSTAVTQGATSILIKALEESGWFIPIEREGLSNLLNERKIIRSSRENFKADGQEQNADIPPLLFAGVLLEGGIISYETNVYTGGAGLKYFGTGGSGQWRQDQVSIYLRAISTQNGRVLKTVYTTKVILSQVVDINLFKYVEFKKLLEAEAGYSYNEPPQLCVTAAIEKAVQSLVIEGIFDKYWELANPEDINSPGVRKYIRERDEIKDNAFVEESMRDYPKFGVGINGGGLQYQGEFAHALTRPSGDLNLNVFFTPEFSLSADAGYIEISAQKYFRSSIYTFGGHGSYIFTPEEKFSFIIQAGGACNYRNEYTNYQSRKIPADWFLSIYSGIGIRYMLTQSIYTTLIANNHYYLTDMVDNIYKGKLNDQVWGLKAGINYIF